jgi:lipoate-protein ligase A
MGIMSRCRLLPTGVASGAMNMALDETLLRSALERRVASLRFYRWSAPTLSLGYFQPHAERLADPYLADADWVRRPTGGAAILHHLEITYALTLPAGSPWHNSESWICRMHDAIATALGDFEVEARAVDCGEEMKLGPFLCFLHQTPGDLLVTGHKVVGSAQRRPHGATMQHGSILLRRSRHAPALPGIIDLSGRSIEEAALERAIVDRLRHATGWTVDADDWTEAERSTAADLEANKYSTAEWNKKR